MNTQKVVELNTDAKPKRQVKNKIEPIRPTHIVEVWRLLRESQIEGRQPYPDTTEESPELIQSHLFQYLQDPLFTGLIARNGKKAVGIVLGRVAQRPYGSPKRYAFVWCIWIAPSARKNGTGLALWSEYTARLKKAGVFHWESYAHEHVEKYLCRESGVQINKLMSIIGGRL